LPQHWREQLTEPYVTTRTKGTGLGLAIVKKIMEDHHGELVLEDGETEGARVSLYFAASELRAAQRPDAANEPMELSPVSHGA
jgi:two-component system nitrogen regulation sensor histidine kinase NtrY